MRVLLINGYPTSSHKGAERFAVFRQQVLSVMKELEKQDVTSIDIIEKTRQQLDEFLFEMNSAFAEPKMITNFDRLDFVFVAGDPNSCPWSPAMTKLALLTKMCMMTGKCLYGSGLGAALLAYECSTAGETLRVINNDGKGAPINDIQAVPAPCAPPSPSRMAPTSSVASTQLRNTRHCRDVLLDTRSGDFFTFDRRMHAWVPFGNTGIIQHSSDHARDYGARVNTARAGTKSHRAESRLGHALVAAKRGDTKCCCRLEAASHALFQGLPHGPSREFLVNCKSAWDLDEEINATGNNKYRVLVDSSRGPMLIEFGNSVGTHFTLTMEHAETCRLLRNFVFAKYDALKVHEHIDRSYVSAITGSARLKDRLQLAQTKSIAMAVPSTSRGNSTETTNASSLLRSHAIGTQPPHAATTTITSGKTSPKRCRPVSAGPYRTASKVTGPIRTIKTSRSVYPSSSWHPPQLEEVMDPRHEDESTQYQSRPVSTVRLQGATIAFTVGDVDSSNKSSSNSSNNNNDEDDQQPLQRRSSSSKRNSVSSGNGSNNNCKDRVLSRSRPATACTTTRCERKLSQELRPEMESTNSATTPRAAVIPTSLSPTQPVIATPLQPDSQRQQQRQQQEQPQQQSVPPAPRRRMIRVLQKNELEKPYCAVDKFNMMRERERQQNASLYYSVVNDAPYMSAAERESLEHQKSKLKWVGGPFRTAVGKASTQIVPEAGIFARGPFDQQNTPFYIIQRRELEVRSPPKQQTARSPPRQQPQTYHASAQRRPHLSARVRQPQQ